MYQLLVHCQTNSDTALIEASTKNSLIILWFPIDPRDIVITTTGRFWMRGRA